MPRVSITISGKNSQPYRFQLDRQKVTIGRSSENDIIIDCPSVSSNHCTMERMEGGYILRDRKSTNGIKLDDEKMAIIDLRNDSDVHVGDVQFGYTLSDDELDELDDEEVTPHAKKASELSDEPVSDKESRPKAKTKTRTKAKANVVTTPRRPAAAPAPVLASSNQGNGFLYGLALIVCGALALFAGLNNSYVKQQENTGREGEISLLSDMKNGRPPLPAAEEE